jgi:hypothetical protein
MINFIKYQTLVSALNASVKDSSAILFILNAERLSKKDRSGWPDPKSWIFTWGHAKKIRLKCLYHWL